MSFQDRFKWSLEMQEHHAIPLYHEYWDIDRVIEVDKEGEDNDAMKELDFSGLDKIIVTEDGRQIQIAQRFRMPYNNEECLEPADFSLRIESYGDSKTEYEKLLRNYEGHGSVPGVYAFGRAPYGRQVGITDGFDEFYLIDLPQFLGFHVDGILTRCDEKPNGDGSKGIYFDLNEIEYLGLIIKSWRGDGE